MELSQQVVSLDLARKLKELGVKQESYFVWINDDTTGEYIVMSLEDYQSYYLSDPHYVPKGILFCFHLLRTGGNAAGWVLYLQRKRMLANG